MALAKLVFSSISSSIPEAQQSSLIAEPQLPSLEVTPPIPSVLFRYERRREESKRHVPSCRLLGLLCRQAG